jgi:hypothetical protein
LYGGEDGRIGRREDGKIGGWEDWLMVSGTGRVGEEESRKVGK